MFTIGGSASAGWPHQPEQTYQHFLEHALRRAFPRIEFEVLDVSGHGFASYRVRTVFEDVVEFDPDLIVLWSGNNEFYEQRTYFGTARSVLQSSHVLRLASVVMRRWFEPENTLSGWGTEERVGLQDLWARIERLGQTLRTDPEQFGKLVEHYRFTVASMLDRAADRDVPVVLLTVPSNLRDWRPLASDPGLDAAAREQWRTRLDAAQRALLEDRSADALLATRAAVAAAPDDAETQFVHGRALEATGDAAAARDAYRRAKDLDLNPMRALTRNNQALRELAAERATVHLLDAERLFDAAADHAAPGFDLFLDYVHPSLRGNLLVARAVYECVLARELVGDAEGAPEFDAQVGDYRDDADLDMSHNLVQLYALTHQHRAAHDCSTRALELLAAGEGIVRRGEADRQRYREFFEMARDVHADYLRNDRARLLGEPFDADYREQLQRAYREKFFAGVYDAIEQQRSR